MLDIEKLKLNQSDLRGTYSFRISGPQSGSEVIF